MKHKQPIMEQGGGLLDCFTAYKFLEWMTTDFKETEAFRAGVIDGNGKFIVPINKQTQKQQKSYSKLNVIVWNIKKLLYKIPGMTSKLGSVAAALFLMKEEIRHMDGGDKVFNDIVSNLELPNPTIEHLTEFHFSAVLPAGQYALVVPCITTDCADEIPLGSVVIVEHPVRPVGNFMGVSVYEGIDSKTSKRLLFVKEAIVGMDNFAGAPVFELETKDYYNSVNGRQPNQRWTKHLDMDSDSNKSIRKFHHNNSNRNIVVKNKMTGEMAYLVRRGQ